ncbi:hypothetical protein [Actinoallomurus sp. NPDC050550]|uniref:hypothetical protein n=1 Tax=Actinoallomurus sp. NPDC050550 TaxID=3154937 RepID=UPI0033FE0C95
MEASSVSHVSYDLSWSLVTVPGLRTDGRDLARTLSAVEAGGATAEMLGLRPLDGGFELTFVIGRAAREPVLAALARTADRPPAVRCRDDVVRLALHGEGMRVDARPMPAFHAALMRAGAATLATATTNWAIEAVCPADALDRAVRSLCAAFVVRPVPPARPPRTGNGAGGRNFGDARPVTARR